MENVKIPPKLETNPNKLFRNAVVPLYNLLNKHCDQIILTGSLALYFYGFDESPNDVDLIIINPDTMCVAELISLEKENPAFSIVKTEYGVSFTAKYQFFYENARVDIFYETETKKCLNYNTIPINPIFDIFEAKRRLDRDKDWKRLSMYQEYLFPLDIKLYNSKT